MTAFANIHTGEVIWHPEYGAHFYGIGDEDMEETISWVNVDGDRVSCPVELFDENHIELDFGMEVEDDECECEDAELCVFFLDVEEEE